MFRKIMPTTAIAVLGLVCRAGGSVTVYSNYPSWQTAAGSFSTITFAELPNNTLITNQYASLGVLFTDGSDYTYYLPNGFPLDGYGLNGAFDSTTLTFAQPIRSIAMHFPGLAQFKLFKQEQLIYTSPLQGGAGALSFTGLETISKPKFP